MKAEKICEVIADHIDEEDNLLSIDVYHSTDLDSYGKTVAYLCLDTHKVIFKDDDYRDELQVKEAIEEAKKNHSLVEYTIEVADADKTDRPDKMGNKVTEDGIWEIAGSGKNLEEAIEDFITMANDEQISLENNWLRLVKSGISNSH